MRKIAIVLAVFHGVNGLVMFVAPALWYAWTPGVVDTGPLNAHLVRDTGLGFLAAAAALAFFARHPDTRQLLAPAIVFLGGHAAIHLAMMVAPGASIGEGLRDLGLIVLPGSAPLALLLRSQRKAVRS
jgi:hypothetical protein